MVAAYRLRMALGGDAEITLFEPADRLGGILRTEQVGGQPMDLGAEAFVLRRPEVPALLAELGLSDRQRATTGVRPLIYSGGRLHSMPADTIAGIPSSAASVADLVDDATIARIQAEPQRALNWTPGSDPAAADLVSDRFGAQVVARLLDPLLGGVYAGSAATIGLRAAAPAVAAALDRGASSLTDAVLGVLSQVTDGPVFGSLRGGYQVLLDELVARSQVRWVRARIDALEPGWMLRDETGEQWHADAVVLAVPAAQVARLVASVAPDTAAAAARIVTASSAVVALAVPADTPFPQSSGVLVATGEPLHAKAITLSSRKWGLSGDVAQLRLSFGRFGDEVAVRTGDDELVAWSLSDLADVFGLAVEVLDVRVQRWIDAMPQYGPGHAGLVAGLRAGLPPTLAVAGSYLDGIGVPACVAAAGRAATSVVEARGTQVAR
ncbi:protoporphyrinogen oxidase [Mycobacterium kiyosense]|uniref:Coproporphyrinogen III oxidase n=1 Tax=Mycobacterium kiyosense TaxID=2871094 RepID=A0A9P3Q638_9MYCO|nr:protoporphyrinogen oxidase [Mycobacterium sp. 20KCMC460]GLB88411.1 protoporphyrinogen oxidase [Mycobacterium kiyosense]GLC01295.1 protoporphyrinogen oxidase [Mycobacterium kiyosense]GLC12535.1 protoporphyrinogen oxidase [Mycobacterium kiyosense]GLD02346.1 protoporphyrinogen oxidase [Mycobacterium kiyosense]